MKKILGLLAAVAMSTYGTAQSVDVVMNAANNGATFNACVAGLYDSGGTGASAPYSNNESYVVTICPDNPNDFITLQWTVFNLDCTDNLPGPPTDADNITIYDGPNTASPTLGTYYCGQLTPGDIFGATPANTSGCLTIEFNSNANGTGDFNAQILCDTPCDWPNAVGEIVGGPAVDSIAVCVNDLVTFQDGGSTPGVSGLFTLEQWAWNWMDGTTDTLLTGGQVQHSWSQPGQYVVQLVVIDDNDCANLNATDIQVFVTTYPSFDPFPSDTLICLGESVQLDAYPDQYETTWSGFPLQTWIDDNCMEDLTGIVQSTPMTITGYDPGISLNASNPDIFSICVDIEHSFIGDFVLQVQCPTGQIMTLHQQGGGGTNLGAPEQGIINCNDPATFGVPWNYCFTPTATETWVDAVNLGWAIPNGTGGNSLPPGDYAPIDPFSALDGCPINGTWQLLFTDLWGADDGSLPGWSINFDPVLNPPVTVFTPQIGVGNDSSYWDMADPWIIANTPDLNSITVEPGAAGSFTYTFTVINSFGCSFDSTVTVDVYESATTAMPDTAVCDGNPVQLNAGSEVCEYTIDMFDDWGDGWNGGYLEVITSQGTFTFDIPFGSNGTGTFFVPTGENFTIQFVGGGWPWECEFTITDPGGGTLYQDGQGGATPNGAVQNFTSNCPGNSTFMPLNGYTYIWDPPAGLNDPNIASPIYSGSSSVTLTLTLYPTGHPDCAQVDTIQIDLGGGLDPGTDSTALLCFEGPAVDLFNWLGGTPGTQNAQWFDPSGNPVAMPITPATAAPGQYEYQIDSSGCQASAFIDVQIFQVSATTTVTNSDCQACNGEILVTPSGGTNPYQYSIDGGVTFQALNNFTALCGGAIPGTNYTIDIQDSLGCVATVSDDVIDDNFPQIDNAVVIDSDCQANNGQVDVATTSSGGTQPYTYSVDGVTGFGPLPLTNLPPSAPTYDLILQDANGCTDTVQITVLEINVPTLDPVVFADAQCFGVCDGTITLTGTNLANYSIDNGVTTQANGNFTGLCPGTYDIIVDNGFGCNVIDQVTIVEPPVLDITSISPDVSICPGEVVNATVTGVNGIGNVTYTWESGGNTVGSGSPAGITFTGGTMVVCATMADDCPTTDTECFTITEPAPVYPIMMADRTNGCEPLTVTFSNLSAGNITTTTWTFSNGQTVVAQGTNDVTVIFENPGQYDVSMEIVTDAGCVYDTTYSNYIEVFANPNANFDYLPIPATIYDSEVTFTDFSSDDVTSWSWDFGFGMVPNSSSLQNPTVIYPEGVPGNYPLTLTVMNDNGCVDSISGQVIVANEVIIYAPNIFTPDGDEYNENWRVYITGIDIYDFHLTMFNRWGEIVWESYNTEGIWNGHYGNGGLVQDGVYVWVIQAKDSYTDKKYEFRGHVTVLK